jgi:hypothetical protein
VVLELADRICPWTSQTAGCRSLRRRSGVLCRRLLWLLQMAVLWDSDGHALCVQLVLAGGTATACWMAVARKSSQECSSCSLPQGPQIGKNPSGIIHCLDGTASLFWSWKLSVQQFRSFCLGLNWVISQSWSQVARSGGTKRPTPKFSSAAIMAIQ